MKWENNIANKLEWSSEIINREQKEQVAYRIAQRVRNGDVIGVGSGSTSFLAVQAIGKRVREEKLAITAIPTSYEVGLACTILGIPTTTLFDRRPDWAFDGADEVDSYNNLIKGRGGVLFAEKLVISSCREVYILADESKFVSYLGEKFPIPVEVFPKAVHFVENKLVSLGADEIKLRLAKGKDGPIITESGNFLLDVRFKQIGSELEKEIKSITGVIESGLFIGYDIEIVK